MFNSTNVPGKAPRSGEEVTRTPKVSHRPFRYSVYGLCLPRTTPTDSPREIMDVPRYTRLRVLALIVMAIGPLVRASHGEAIAPRGESPRGISREVLVTANVALASLIALSDGYLEKMADSLHIMANDGAVQTGDWEHIKAPFRELAARNVAALNWYAAPDGSYWSVQNGREPGNLAKRAYFPLVLNGQTVIGDLVISTRTGKPVAIVAVPVTRPDGTTIGILGASVYLDKLSALIDRQMGLENTMIFYSFDENDLVALDWDPSLIFFDPSKSADQDVAKVFKEMRAHDRGVVSYRFRGKERTVVFRRSPVTHWWYAFGLTAEGRAPGSRSGNAQ